MKAYTARLFLIFFLSISLATAALQAETLLFDSFESADKSTTNADGFSWSTGVDIVTMDPGPVTVWSGGQSVYEPGPSRENWTARDGKHSLGFKYAAGSHWREQRFHLGKPKREVWIRYWIRVPTNFTHGSATPSNNKFFFLWSDIYGGKPSIGVEFWREDSGSRLTWYQNSGGHQGHFSNFMRWPEDRGRWMEITMHFKTATGTGTNDGVFELWRRWENESTPTKFVSEHGLDLALSSGQPDGFLNGYIMGYANAAYAEDTYWLVDNFTVSTTPFSDVGGTATEPRAPANVQLRLGAN